MRHIFITGGIGSGKTHLAHRLGGLTGFPADLIPRAASPMIPPPLDSPAARTLRPVIAALLCSLVLLTHAGAAPVQPPVDLGDLPRGQLPLHDWWVETAWNDPGGWTEVDPAAHGLPPDRDDLDAAAVLNELFRETSGNTILQLAPGTYTLRTPLVFSRDGLRLRGAGRDQTRLRFAPGIPGDAIRIAGELDSKNARTVASAPRAGSRTLTLESTEGLRPGTHLWLSQREPKAFGQIVRIASLDGTTATLDRALSLDFSPDRPTQAAVLTPRTACAVEDLAIDRTQDPRLSTISIAHASGILLRGLELISTEFAHVYLWRAQEVLIEDCVIHHSRHYGVGGSGYGVSFNAGTTRCLVRNNAIYHLRHATVFGGYACFNVIAGNYLRSDQGHLDERHHGTYPFANLYEDNDALAIVADSRADKNGPWNTHFRNRATRIEAGPGNQNAVAPFFVVANRVQEQAEGTYAALNQVGGTLVPGALPATARLPRSLYRSTADSPRIGPDAPDFGAAATWPAEAWVPPIHRGGPETLVTLQLEGAKGDAAVPARIEGTASLRTTARMGAAGSRIHVFLENAGTEPLRIRVTAPAYPPGFGGLLRARAWENPGAPPAAIPETEPTFLTDFSPKTGHAFVLSAQSSLTLEMADNPNRLSR